MSLVCAGLVAGFMCIDGVLQEDELQLPLSEVQQLLISKP
jgi:hypothetical protein